MSQQLAEVPVGAVLNAGVLFCEKVVHYAGEAVVVVEAAQAGRDAECTSEVGRSRVGSNRALLHTRMGVV